MEPENITIKATIKLPSRPTRISGAEFGIENAVAKAVEVVIKSSNPVFSATPSMVIMLLSYPSHHAVPS